MTDNELLELVDEQTMLSNSLAELTKIQKVAQSNYDEISKKITEERRNRKAVKEMSYYVNDVTDIINHYNNPKCKDKMYIIQINGCIFSSGRSKRSWTSEKRAKEALVDYIVSKESYRLGTKRKEVRMIVDKLAAEGKIIIRNMFDID